MLAGAVELGDEGVRAGVADRAAAEVDEALGVAAEGEAALAVDRQVAQDL
ncbi:MAG: hypothetical protein IPO88_24800 [Nannocystis sp.]|nr:hypothetical protein [Nannocystis sp.]MBK9756661.1 hypothetical protein [Nannocystis sp.]